MSDLGTNHDRAILAAMQRRRAGESVIDLADDYTDGYPTRLVDQFADLGLRAFAEVERLRELLEWHTDDDPCRFDHNGHCQAHCDFSIEPGQLCHVEQSRRALGRGVRR